MSIVGFRNKRLNKAKWNIGTADTGLFSMPVVNGYCSTIRLTYLVGSQEARNENSTNRTLVFYETLDIQSLLIYFL